MGKTLHEKWVELDEKITQVHQTWIDDYFKDKERPAIVYALNGWRGIHEQTITSWGLFQPKNHKPWYNKKPTRKDLDKLQMWFDNLIPKEEYILLYYKYKPEFSLSGNVTGAHNFLEIETDSYRSFNKGELEKRLLELQEIYAPREGHEACTYCRKQVLPASMVEYTVIARQYTNMRKTSKYCSLTCGVNDQMAHEG
jgi:hypothetical protein